MREILYRGKQLGNGEWVYGDLSQHPEGKIFIAICEEERATEYRVDPNTIGEFTGLSAPKKKRHLDARIFEGDLFRSKDDVEYVVMYIQQRAAFSLVESDHYEVLKDNDCENEQSFDWLFYKGWLCDFSVETKNMTKIGNIHDKEVRP